MRSKALISVVAVLLAGCAGGTEPTSTTGQPDQVAESETTTTAPTATTTLLTTTTTLAATTTTQPPSAADALADFFAAAEDLDAKIATAAEQFNAGLDRESQTLDVSAKETIEALTASHVASLIPAGMEPALETAVLAVFADLDSRIAALDGAARLIHPLNTPEEYDNAMNCLAHGSESKERFGVDLIAARTLAEQTPPPPMVAADSPQAGILEIQKGLIFLFNHGCDSCGGAIYDGPIPVDWDARTIGDGVGFEAIFDGSEWEIRINAC